MRTIDLSPLYRRSVGYDNLNRLMDSVAHVDGSVATYPPYDILKVGEDSYRITMAVAGFTEEELGLSVEDNELLISGAKDEPEDEKQAEYLHHGIANRSFERKFELADYIRVDKADLNNGLLSVDLVREVPEHMKPRTIKIISTSKHKAVEHKAA